MAIVEINERLRPRSGSINEKFQREYERTFDVITNNPHDGVAAVIQAVGIPIGDDYATDTEFDTLAKCKNVSADCDADDGKRWLVKVSYGAFDLQSKQQAENPLNALPVKSGSFQQFERVVDKTIDGKSIVNKAGVPFDPPITKDDSRPILTIKRNEALDPSVKQFLYRDAINTDEFFGAPAGTVKVLTINFVQNWHAECGYYYEVEYQFIYNPEGWQKSVLNQGKLELQDGELIPILAQGVPVSEPVLLNAAGAKLPEGQPAIYLDFKIYNEMPFAALGLS